MVNWNLKKKKTAVTESMCSPQIFLEGLKKNQGTPQFE
jgi:hypothetical protein